MANVVIEPSTTQTDWDALDRKYQSNVSTHNQNRFNADATSAGMPQAAKDYVVAQNDKKAVGYIRNHSKAGSNGMPSDVAITQDKLDSATGMKNTNKINSDNTKSTTSSSSSSKTPTDLKVGDTVQIKDGGIDVTSGARAKKGKMYGEGGPLWATVTSITENYETGSKFGLPAKVTKVQCSNKDVIVWQVPDTDIAGQTIKKDKVDKTAVKGKKTKQTDTDYYQGTKVAEYLKNQKTRRDVELGSSSEPFSPDGKSDKWYEGFTSTTVAGINKEVAANRQNTAYISDSMFAENASKQTPSYNAITGNIVEHDEYLDTAEYRAFLRREGYSIEEIDLMMEEALKDGTSPAGLNTGAVFRADYLTSWESEGRRKELLNDEPSLIQNQSGFPKKAVSAKYKKRIPAKYDYQIILDDTELKNLDGYSQTYDKKKKNKKKANHTKLNFEDRLAQARAALGLTVHGDPGIAKLMKMYMYNRFRVPDTNLVLSKTFTHVFFTRPDLNIMDGETKANWQTRNHTDAALIWRTHPELFKLLTDYRRCGDNDNFNLLLSQNVVSFDLDDEKIDTAKGGASWADHAIMYGQQYTGRTAGEFSCSFVETSNFDIITMMKLWVTYIDNVGRGAWSPYYYTEDGGKTVTNKKTEWCHVYDRALDYAASVYIFVCGPDGEEVLYWSKYYGVFPTTTGSSALRWDATTPVGDVSKVNINFAYSCKKDLSPISLLEFNNVANVDGATEWVPGFTAEHAGSARPFVGSPYIEIDLGTPIMNPGDVDRAGSKATKIRLKFREASVPSIPNRTDLDNLLFRTTYVESAKDAMDNMNSKKKNKK